MITFIFVKEVRQSSGKVLVCDSLNTDSDNWRQFCDITCTKMLTFYMDIYVLTKNFHFLLLFLPKLCGCLPIVKFLQKTLWVPGPRGPGVPHLMDVGTILIHLPLSKRSLTAETLSLRRFDIPNNRSDDKLQFLTSGNDPEV